MRHIFVIAIVSLLLILTKEVSAQWIQTDGPYAVTVECLTASRSNLLAGTNLGVYLSTDKGENWSKVNTYTPNPNNHLPSVTINAIVSIDTIIFAGTDGKGVYRSIDSGNTWTKVNVGLKNTYIWKLSIIDSTVFALPQGKGIYRTTDYGENWIESDSGLTNTRVFTIFRNGANLFAGTDSGLFVSSDSGRKWTLTTSNIKTTAITCSATSGRNIYLGTYTGVYRSADSGANWVQVNNGLTNIYIQALIAKGTNLFAGSTNGIFLSTDGGVNWTEDDDRGLLYSRVTAFAEIDTDVFVSAGYAVFHAQNSGQSWLMANRGLSFANSMKFVESRSDFFTYGQGGVYHLLNNDKWDQQLEVTDYITDLAIEDNIYLASGGFTDGGFGNLYLSLDSGRNWLKRINFGNSLIQSVAIIDSIFFAATDRGIIYRSLNRWVTWDSIDLGPAFKTLFVKGKTLFVGTDDAQTYRSTDFGLSWQTINIGLTTKAVNTFASYGSEILVGTGDGIYISSTDGDSWIRLDPGFKDTNIMYLAVNGSNIYASLSSTDIFQSTNKGLTWTQRNDGLPVNNIGAIATHNSNLYAALNFGGIWRRQLSDFAGLSKQISTENNELVIYPNYPNPFSSQTTISFSTNKSEFIDVKIFDLLGKEIAHLYSGVLDAGNHSFQWNSANLTLGIYTCNVRATDGSNAEQLIIVK